MREWPISSQFHERLNTSCDAQVGFTKSPYFGSCLSSVYGARLHRIRLPYSTGVMCRLAHSIEYMLSSLPPPPSPFYRDFLSFYSSQTQWECIVIGSPRNGRKKNSMSYVEKVDTRDARYFFCWFRCCVCYVYHFVHWNRLNDLWSFENGTHTQFCQWMGTDPPLTLLTRVHWNGTHKKLLANMRKFGYKFPIVDLQRSSLTTFQMPITEFFSLPFRWPKSPTEAKKKPAHTTSMPSTTHTVRSDRK